MVSSPNQVGHGLDVGGDKLVFCIVVIFVDLAKLNRRGVSLQRLVAPMVRAKAPGPLELFCCRLGLFSQALPFL